MIHWNLFRACRLRKSFRPRPFCPLLEPLEDRRLLATYTVNSAADEPDANPGDGVALTASGVTTLRAAIQEANLNPNTPGDPDVIRFNGPDLMTIALLSDLDAITEAVIIDGYSHPLASVNTLALGNNANIMVELDGQDLYTALVVAPGGEGTIIRGLSIVNSSGAGILLQSGNNQILGNFIGLRADGITLGPNFSDGVRIEDASGNQIGSSALADRNLITGNQGDPGANVHITGRNASGNRVQGNFIGTERTGTSGFDGFSDGVRIVNAPNNLIGGPNPGEGNLIAFNGGIGIKITTDDSGGQADQNTVQGNKIQNNAADGVFIFDAFFNLIGGVASGEGNIITDNGRNGVTVVNSVQSLGFGNQILGNSIFANTGLGIDLGDDDVTLNDPGDTDFGPNSLQNFPDLTAVIAAIGSITIQGTFNGEPNQTFRLEFFASPVLDPSGFGEGQQFLGFIDIMTDGSGNATFSATVAVPVHPGAFVTATATNLDPSFGGTSEFSRGIPIPPPPDRPPDIPPPVPDLPPDIPPPVPDQPPVPPPLLNSPSSSSEIPTLVLALLAADPTVSFLLGAAEDRDPDAVLPFFDRVAQVTPATTRALVFDRVAGTDLFALFPDDPRAGEITGAVFEDYEGTGDRLGKTPQAGVLVYLDLNGNAARDDGEPVVITNHRGEYRFAGLKAGTYVVRQLLAPQIVQTFPNKGAQNVELPEGRVIQDVNFGIARVRGRRRPPQSSHLPMPADERGPRANAGGGETASPTLTADPATEPAAVAGAVPATGSTAQAGDRFGWKQLTRIGAAWLGWLCAMGLVASPPRRSSRRSDD